MFCIVVHNEFQLILFQAEPQATEVHDATQQRAQARVWRARAREPQGPNLGAMIDAVVVTDARPRSAVRRPQEVRDREGLRTASSCARSLNVPQVLQSPLVLPKSGTRPHACGTRQEYVWHLGRKGSFHVSPSFHSSFAGREYCGS